jgi:hypothetical protein
MSREELAGLKVGNLLVYFGIDVYMTVIEVQHLRGVLVRIDGTCEEVFVDSEEVLDLELFV